MQNHPYMIAITGGPCAGKTTLLTTLECMGDMTGCTVLFVPEAATMLVERGLRIGEDVRHFQTETLRLQLQLEKAAHLQANAVQGPCAIICDRGTLDGAGYCMPGVFDAIAAEFGESRLSLSKRYDLVVHLTSAALEAPEAYTIDNNNARHETLEEAIEQELRTREAWEGHPNRIIVTSTKGFEDKLAQAIGAIQCALQEYASC